MLSDAGSIVSLIQTGGVTTLLILIVFGGMRGWYVWRYHYEEMKQDRDEWKTIALDGTSLSHRALNVAERASNATRNANP